MRSRDIRNWLQKGTAEPEENSGGSGNMDGSIIVFNEEADDCMMFHLNYAIQVDTISKRPDTDVFICSVYHFNRWIYFNHEELWDVSGRSNAVADTPVHNIGNQLDNNVIDVLPAVHALTDCDTTSKAGSKFALQAAINTDTSLVYEPVGMLFDF